MLPGYHTKFMKPHVKWAFRVLLPLLAKQLNWTDEKELLIGDTPEKFAEQCLRLYENDQSYGKNTEKGFP